jgi:hypothetical protein
LGPITDSTTANSTNRAIGVIIRVDGMLPSAQSHRYGQWRRYLRRVLGRRGRKKSRPDPILLLNDFASDGLIHEICEFHRQRSGPWSEMAVLLGILRALQRLGCSHYNGGKKILL